MLTTMIMAIMVLTSKGNKQLYSVEKCGEKAGQEDIKLGEQVCLVIKERLDHSYMTCMHIFLCQQQYDFLDGQTCT